jgi:hypothetical protein
MLATCPGGDNDTMGATLVNDRILQRLVRRRGQKPVFLEFRSSKVFILLAVCWSVFTVSYSIRLVTCH